MESDTRHHSHRTPAQNCLSLCIQYPYVPYVCAHRAGHHTHTHAIISDNARHSIFVSPESLDHGFVYTQYEYKMNARLVSRLKQRRMRRRICIYERVASSHVEKSVWIARWYVKERLCVCVSLRVNQVKSWRHRGRAQHHPTRIDICWSIQPTTAFNWYTKCNVRFSMRIIK